MLRCNGKYASIHCSFLQENFNELDVMVHILIARYHISMYQNWHLKTVGIYSLGFVKRSSQDKKEPRGLFFMENGKKTSFIKRKLCSSCAWRFSPATETSRLICGALYVDGSSGIGKDEQSYCDTLNVILSCFKRTA